MQYYLYPAETMIDCLSATMVLPFLPCAVRDWKIPSLHKFKMILLEPLMQGCDLTKILKNG